MSNKAKIGFSLFSCVYLVTTSLSGDALARRRLVPDMPSVEIHYEALMALKAVPQETSSVSPSVSGWQQGAPKITPPTSTPSVQIEKTTSKTGSDKKTQHKKPVKEVEKPLDEPKSPVIDVPKAAAPKPEVVKPIAKKEEKKPLVAPAIADVAKPVETPKVLPEITKETESVKPLQPDLSQDTSLKADEKPEVTAKPVDSTVAPKDNAPVEALPPLVQKESVIKDLEASAKEVKATANAELPEKSKDELLPPLQPSSQPSAVTQPTAVNPPSSPNDEDEVLPAMAVPVSSAPNVPLTAPPVVVEKPSVPAEKTEEKPVVKSVVEDDDDDAPVAVAPVQKDEGFFSGLKKATKKLIGSESPKLQAKPRAAMPIDDDEDAPAANVVTPPATPNAAVAPVAPVVVDEEEGATPLPPLPKTSQAAPVNASQDIAALQVAKGSELPSLELLKSKNASSQEALGSVAAVKDEPLPPLPATSSSAPKVALHPSDTPFGKPSMEAVKPSKPVPAPVAVVESEELPPLPASAKQKTMPQVVMPPAVETVAAGASAPTQLASLETPPAASTPVLPKAATKTGNALASIAFAEGEIQLPKGQESVLADVAKQKKNMILVLAYADPKSNNTNVRHEALARALAIRATLIDSGMVSNNIRTEVKSDAIPAGAANRVDIISDDEED